MPKNIGYLRVSTLDQDNEKFKADALHYVNDRDFGKIDFIEEKVTGKKSWKKRKLWNVIQDLQAGDRLIVPELSRLGRSMLEIMEILAIAKEKEICIYAIKNDWELNGTIESKIIAMVFSMAAEIEHDLIVKRTNEGIAAARARGVKFGRPKGPGKSKLDKHREEIVALLNNGSTQKYIAKRYGTTPPNLCNWIKKNKIRAEPIYPKPKKKDTHGTYNACANMTKAEKAALSLIDKIIVNPARPKRERNNDSD